MRRDIIAQVTPSPLRALSCGDIVVCMFIVAAGISGLRSEWGIADELGSLRAELLRRELGVA